MIEVESTVKIYDVDGEENTDESKILKISNHWKRNSFVNIVLPGSSKFTVNAKDLEAAIQNAKNSAAF